MYHNDVSWLDRFCARHPKFGIPNLMMYIALGNVAIGLIDNFSSYPLSAALFFLRSAIFQGEVWRLVTFIFVLLDWQPAGEGVGHGEIQLLFLLRCAAQHHIRPDYGRVLHRVCQHVHVLCFRRPLSGHADFVYAHPPGEGKVAGLGRRRLFPLAGAQQHDDGALAVRGAAPGGRLKLFHLLLAGFPRSAQTINFKKAQKELRQRRGYLHKCAVCGITDQDDPDMEFRYCSKCSGYYCYCASHINNHTHVQ